MYPDGRNGAGGAGGRAGGRGSNNRSPPSDDSSPDPKRARTTKKDVSHLPETNKRKLPSRGSNRLSSNNNNSDDDDEMQIPPLPIVRTARANTSAGSGTGETSILNR